VDETCHLILSSRTLLTLPDLPLMVARSQVGGLGFEELAFTANEIQALILQNYHLTMPESVAVELAQETEGWITGLLLSAETMWHGMIDRVRIARVSGVGLYEYLAQQVLDQQPAHIRDFLLRTSLLEEFDTELCEAVFGSSGKCQGLIDTVLQRNLFILPVEDERTWLRYHHLFRDFLQAILAQEQPNERDRVLRRLADVYAERRQWEKAHSSYQRLGDAAATADFIEKVGPLLAQNGRLLLLAEWLDALPGKTMAPRPGLFSLRGIVAVMLGEVERGLQLLNKAEAGFRNAGDWPQLADTLVRRATAHRFRGDYQASLADSDEALSLTEGQGSLNPVHAKALRSRGLSLYWMGALDAAIECLEQSLNAYIALNDKEDGALLLTELGMAYRNAGRYGQALSHYERALAYWQEVQNEVRQATLLNNLGVLYHLRGDYVQASSLLEEALDRARKSGYTRMEALALTGIGDLYVDLDAPEAALDAYGQAGEIARHTKDLFLLFYLNLAEVELALSKSEFLQAHNRLEVAHQLAHDSNSRHQQGLWELAAGRLTLAEGEISEALGHLDKAARCFEDGGQRVEGAQCHMYLAGAYHTLGDRKAALSHLAHAFSTERQHALIIAGRKVKAVLEAGQNDHVLGAHASRLLQQIPEFEDDIPLLRRRLRRRASSVPIDPPRLIIQALGTTRVELGGKPVTEPAWQSRRLVRELCFVFLAHPEGLSKEAVGAILWPDSSPAQLKLRFKNAIFRLRRALGQDVILFHNNLYRFNRALDYEYDVEVFLERIARARTATEPAKQAAAYLDAVRLYKGPYLLEAEGTWVWAVREHLCQEFLKAVLALAEYKLEAAEYEGALNYCQRALSDDPCFEAAHRVAMRVYAAMGNRADVARQFERCRLALGEEINAAPSQETQTLYEILIR
jgi:LuxR family maltose regulon positive regulatory protein